ncbi:MAG: 2,3-bisphosphoglycerate-independent phosphoglycerate mutase [Oscillospiraceae bacterium]|nr:2,3-bisphosphoglycerate-independent phosphoglycerate mutase [Oscillospiraceae bacterium]
MKYIILIGDGMADNPIHERQGRTPLELADIPNMDKLANRGTTGLAMTVPKGLEPGSDTAILSIFGYNPEEFFSGRSPLEAAGLGIDLNPGDFSFRCNMVSLDDAGDFSKKKILSHSGGSVDGSDALALMDALTDNGTFGQLAQENGIEFYKTPSFRHIAVQRNYRRSLDSDFCTFPPHEYISREIGEFLPHGESGRARGLRGLMGLSYGILDGHPINQERRTKGRLPANCIWFWAEGSAAKLPRFAPGGLVVTAVPLVRGIARLIGLEVAEVAGATGDISTNYEGKAAAVLKGLSGGLDFAALHVEAPDECTHNGDLEGKIKSIESIDKRCLGPLLDGLSDLGEEFRILILSDHKTLISTRGHDAGAVPYILYDSREQKCSGRPYSERECEKGGLVGDGTQLIDRLLENTMD